MSLPTTPSKALPKATHRHPTRRLRAMLWSMAFIVLAAMALPTGYVLISLTSESAVAQSGGDANPRANFWRAVREGNAGYSAVKGPEANTLINASGQDWRAARTETLQKFGGWIPLGMLALIIVFLALRGRIRIEEPRSGMMVPRWNVFERSLHWYTAILFVLLTITGLSMLFGRSVLIPLLGSEAFAGWAGISIQLHNTIGPFFTGGVAIMFILWVWHNIPNAVDITWFKRGGGLVNNAHPSAGRLNGGEKVWFWIVTVLGLGFVCWSGFVLMGWLESLIPTSRDIMQTYQMIHAWAALIWVAIFLGHAYIGTLGTEGALEGMTRGKVSVEWARQHHDLWYEDVKDKALRDHTESPANVSGTERPA